MVENCGFPPVSQHSYGKSAFIIRKSCVNGGFSIAMPVYWKVTSCINDFEITWMVRR